MNPSLICTWETFSELKVSAVFIKPLTGNILETKGKIIASAEELFMQYGIRSVTMDDVARQSAMSKKTIYQYFDNKDSLVLAVAVGHFEREKIEFLEIESESINAVHELILVTQCIRKHVFKMNPSLLFDLQKYHRASWDSYLNFKHETIRGQIARNIERGKREGLYRHELDAEILSIFRVEQVQLVFDPSIFPTDKFDFRVVQLQIMDHFVNGLLTDKGRETYQEFTEKERDEPMALNIK